MQHITLHSFRLPLLALVTACSAPQAVVRSGIPEPLVIRCESVVREFGLANDQGRHTPIAVTSVGATPAASLAEAELAARLLQGRAGGQTWVLARGGTGKSHLAWALQAQTCGKVATFRLDVTHDLRARLAVATAARPALAAALLDQLGAGANDDPADALRQHLGGGSWLLLLDGTDEMTQSERRIITRELTWLARADVPQPHLVRFERPGFVDATAGTQVDATFDLPELSCAQVDAHWARQPAGPQALAAGAWRTSHGMERKRAGSGTCQYVHMATYRDLETVADLAQDAAAGQDDLPATATRADIYAAWLAHRLGTLATTTRAALGWLDGIMALGVLQASEPDLVLTLDRCAQAPTPGSLAPIDVCKGLVKSKAVRPGTVAGTWTLPNQTVADLLLARWLVAKYNDCNLLAAATADVASLELTAMVAAQPGGRRCLTSLVGAVCSRGTPASEISEFMDEALPRDDQYQGLLAGAAETSTAPCERAVYAALLAP